MGCAGCVFSLFALISPRLILFIIWAFTTVNDMVFKGWLWPLLGFFFAPYTTLAYIGVKSWSETGEVSGEWIALIVFGVLMDLLSVGSIDRKAYKS